MTERAGMNLAGWEAEHMFTCLEYAKVFPGVVFKSPRHLVNIWGKPTIGSGTEIGAFVEIGDGVVIGERCKIGAYTFIPPGVIIGNDVFVGPRTTFTNDKNPPSPKLEWLRTVVEDAVVIGANATILPGVVLYQGATVGAGAVVTRDVQPYTVVVGNPAKLLQRRV